MIAVQYYAEASGRSPFAGWFNGLSDEAAAKVTIALKRAAQVCEVRMPWH
jgi:hypothetical protein